MCVLRHQPPQVDLTPKGQLIVASAVNRNHPATFQDAGTSRHAAAFCFIHYLYIYIYLFLLKLHHLCMCEFKIIHNMCACLDPCLFVCWLVLLRVDTALVR